MMRFNNLDLYQVNYKKIINDVPKTNLIKFKNDDVKKFRFKSGRYYDRQDMLGTDIDLNI